MTDIDTALEMLQEAVDKEIASARSQGAKAFELGNYGQAKKQIKRSEELEEFQKQVAKLYRTYKGGRPSRGEGHRLKKGEGTHQKAYYEPILQALNEMNGRGEAAEVLNRVEEIMRPELKEVDYERVKDGSFRWQTKCRFARWNLVHEQGKLRSDSPRGIWELADRD